MTAQSFRATTDIHMGQYERTIPKDSVVTYDGKALDVDGEKLVMPATRFAAACKVSWFVPVSDTTTMYQPQPAGVTVGPAQQAGESKRSNQMVVETVESDERIVGTRDGFRAHQQEMERSGGKRTLSEEERSRGAGVQVADHMTSDNPNALKPSRGMKVERGDLEDQEGQIVGTLRPANADRVDVSGQVFRDELRRTDPVGGAPLQVEKLAADKTAYTGDVRTATSGTELSDLFAEADTATVGYQPVPGVAGEPPEVTDVEPQVRQVTRPQVEPDEADLSADALLEAKFEAARTFVPGFEWDMSRHWRVRVADALQQNTMTRTAILVVEIESVKKHIIEGLKLS